MANSHKLVAAADAHAPATHASSHDVGGSDALSSAPQFTTVELGHATDTTIARASAGNLTVEGNALYRAGGTDVAVADGGTGASTAAAAIAALGGIPATIFDAAGDIIVASAADTAARLALGATDGMALRRVGGAVAWDFPPGHEFDYVAVTSTVNPTATTEATANTVVTANAITYDGSTVIMLEFFCPSGLPANSIGANMLLWLYDGAGSIGAIGGVGTPAASTSNSVIRTARRITPTAAAHTYSVRASVSTGTGTLNAGAGGAGVYPPIFIRQIKV